MLAPLLAAAVMAPPSLESIVDKAVDTNQVPGVVVVIRKDGKTIFQRARGYANLEMRTRMNLDSVHELASVSKQFTATAIMKLVEDRKLALNDPLNKFIENPPKEWADITIENLLEHTSGLPDYLGSNIDLGAEFTARELVYGLINKPLLFAPGTKWAYCNTGYMTLGYLVEQVTKQPFGKYVTDQVFIPSGMKSARIGSLSAIIPNRAYGYQKSGKEWVNEAYVSRGLSALGDGMVMASANDLLSWHETLTNGRILHQESWQAMWTPSSQSQGKYGFGFGVERAGPKPRLNHSGGWVGTNTFLMSDIESDSCIIVLINTDQSPMGDLIKAAYERLNKKL